MPHPEVIVVNKPRSIFDFKSEEKMDKGSSTMSLNVSKSEKVGDRLKKMLTKYEGLFDTEHLCVVQDSVLRAQNSENILSKATEVSVDGKIMVISDPVRRYFLNLCRQQACYKFEIIHNSS